MEQTLPSYQKPPAAAGIPSPPRTPRRDPSHASLPQVASGGSRRKRRAGMDLPPPEASRIRGFRRFLVGITALFVLCSAGRQRWGGGGGGRLDGEEEEDALGTFADGNGGGGGGGGSSRDPPPPLLPCEGGGGERDGGQAAALLRSGSETVPPVPNGAVATDHPACSEIGTRLLRDGAGTAADAAVAAALCLGVVHPAGSGLGGGALVLVHHHPPGPEGGGGRRTSTEFIDASSTVPGRFRNQGGGRAVAVPGQLRGLEELHARFGRLSWQAVVEPAMVLARDGFAVTALLERELDLQGQGGLGGEVPPPPLARMLSRDGDGKTWYREGDTMRRPEYAGTLRAVMEGRADALYGGPIAAAIARDVQEAGGVITEADLAGYRPILRDPLVARDVGGFTLVGAPPPSSGGAAVLGAARFLAGYADSPASFSETVTRHRLVEACRHVFGVRMAMADPATSSDDAHRAALDLIRGPLIAELRNRTSDSGVLSLSKYGGDEWNQLEDEYEPKDRKGSEDWRAGEGRRGLLDRSDFLGETHLSVVDGDRNAVSITSTIGSQFGSKVASPTTGIIFNDEMDYYDSSGRPEKHDLLPTPDNNMAPGKRSMSSMSPTLVFRNDEDGRAGGNGDGIDEENDLGRLFMVLGGSGGPKIITAVLQVFVNHALLGMPLYDSVIHPRLHEQLLFHGTLATGYDQSALLQGPVIEVSNTTRGALKRRGRNTLVPMENSGAVQAIAVDLETDLLTAVSDPRKVGSPAGY